MDGFTHYRVFNQTKLVTVCLQMKWGQYETMKLQVINQETVYNEAKKSNGKTPKPSSFITTISLDSFVQYTIIRGIMTCILY